jgi:transcriptional regulator with XRE-family HTH domain
LRIERGLTQEEVALTSGVTRPLLVQVEHGQRGLLYERLFDIAEALGVPVSALMEGPSSSPRRTRVRKSGGTNR